MTAKRKPEPPAVVARRKAKQRQRQSELLNRVNAKLSPLGFDWKSLLSAIDADIVEVRTKENIMKRRFQIDNSYDTTAFVEAIKFANPDAQIVLVNPGFTPVVYEVIIGNEQGAENEDRERRPGV